MKIIKEKKVALVHSDCSYIDKDGNLSKPFLLPQANPDYYDLSLFSFNIPELVKNAIEVDNYELVQTSKYGKATKIK